MKVWTLAPKENWIIDRFVDEWNQDNPDITTHNIYEADIIWLMADFCWRQIPLNLLQTKKVVTTIHHIVPEKFDKQEFLERDLITDIYHVPNEYTLDFVKQQTTKTVVMIPYWANQKIWKQTASKVDLKKKYKILENFFVIGSFQRDTEGKDNISPKLEKGPDLLVDAIEKLNKQQNVFVVLSGWRRQYVIDRLKDKWIPYVYIERPEQSIVNELYQTLDLYLVTARYEGGPQSLIECGLLNVPVRSTPMGMAKQLLPTSSISDDVTVAISSVPNVEHLKLPMGYTEYRNLFKELLRVR